MTTNSTWTALRNAAFRKLWIAAVISETCVAAYDSAAAWMMNIFTGSPLLLSLMSTGASLPFFLLTLPAGIIGPALGGLLVPLAGANFVFALNGACFLLVVVATRQWKQPTLSAKLPSESLFESFGTLSCYIRHAPRFQVVLARNFLFAPFISVIPALMSVMGLQVLHLSSSNLGLLFTSMGAGSVLGAVLIMPWLRARFSPDSVTLSANLLLVLVYLLMAFVRETEVFFVVAALGGVRWTMSASELWVAAQRAIPSWARGRLNATVIVISQGAMALGGVIWGFSWRNNRSKLHVVWRGGSIPDEPTSVPSAFDQLCRKPRRVGFGRSIYFCRTKREKSIALTAELLAA